MINPSETSKTATGDNNNIQEQQPQLQPRVRRTYVPSKERLAVAAKEKLTNVDPPFVEHWDSSATAKPRPDWYWQIKSARPWMIVHVEHGPPKPRPLRPEPAPGEEEQRPPATVGKADLIDGVISQPQASPSKTIE